MKRTLLQSLLVFLIGAAATVSSIVGAAYVDGERAREHVVEAVESSALASGAYREIELVPGLVVMESDNFSTCVMLSQMFGPAESVFGEGIWGTGSGDGCAQVYAAIAGEPRVQTTWYRYWHGASALGKLLLTVLPFQAVQVLLSIAIALLVTIISWRVWRYSKALGVGIAITLILASDVLWHGLSLVHGITASVGLTGVLAVLISFERRWSARWGVVLLAGFTYAATAQMLIPIAFAILSATVAMLPLLTSRPSKFGPWTGLVVGTGWIVGYALGLLSRYIWVSTLGPGAAQLSEISGSSQIYLTQTLVQPFHATLGLLMKTWLGVGWMQIGLIVVAGTIGWILARGGSRALLQVDTLIVATPILLGFGWLVVWAGHTNHTFVNVLLASMLVSALFTIDYSRHKASLGPRRRNNTLDRDNSPTEADHHSG